MPMSVSGAAGITAGQAVNWTSPSSTYNMVFTKISNPSLASSITTGLNQPYSLFVSGKYAYVVNNNVNTMSIVDVSNPASPSFTSSVTVWPGVTGPRAIFVSGKYAYVSGNNTTNGSLSIIDISNPASPSTISKLFVPNIANTFVAGKYAYVTETGSLAVVDVSNPSSPSVTSSVAANAPGLLFVSGKYAYVASSQSMSIFDISNPASPSFTSSVVFGNSSGWVFVSGRYAYISVSGSLAVVDVSNPSSPSVTSSVAVTNPYDVFVSGRYAYVGDFAGPVLRIIDISNPASPSLASTIGFVGPTGVFVSGRYAYVTDYTNNSLAIVNVAAADLSNIETGNIRADTANFVDYVQVGNLYARDSLNADNVLIQRSFAAPQFIQGGSVNSIIGSTLVLYPSTFSIVPDSVMITDVAASTLAAAAQYTVANVSTSSFTLVSSIASTFFWEAKKYV